MNLAATRRRPQGWSILRYLALGALCLVWIYPFLWLVSASLKTPIEIFAKGLNLIPDTPVWENYVRAWGQAGFSTYMLNTVIVTVGTVAVVVFHTALTGYVLGRYDFVGRKVIIGILAATLVVPAGLTIIPIVDLVSALGLLNGHWGIILALAGSGQSAAILLYAGYFRGLPRELEEAATMDGAGFLRVFFYVMMPLAGPVTATVTVLTFLAAWNAFLIPHEDRVFLCNEQGELIIARLDGEGYHEISRAQLLEPTAPDSVSRSKLSWPRAAGGTCRKIRLITFWHV
jgi:raffinose/stachyose/melibiose transport system permease protein